MSPDALPFAAVRGPTVLHKRADLELTGRQCEVLAAFCRSGDRQVVASELNVTKQTICKVLKAAYRRMGVRADTQAALKFDRWSRRQGVSS